ncbi:MAG: hypothetical protein U0793_08635 [Gemmataceae bacterium]
MRRLFSYAGACLVLGLLASSVAAEWGTIKGRIIWGGETIPEREDLTPLVMKNPDAAFCLKDGKLLDEKWVIDKKTKGIQWTFVWLAPAPDDKEPLPIHPKLKAIANKKVEIDQPVCMYLPHAIGLREGQELVVKNNAKVAHNVLYVGPDGAGNPLVLPGKELVIDNLKASKAPTSLSCSIHTWMKAWVRVFDHPYYAVTGPDGSFEIKNAPAGKYRLVVWHGTGGFRFGAAGRAGQPITIDADKTTDLKDLKFPPPK